MTVIAGLAIIPQSAIWGLGGGRTYSEDHTANIKLVYATRENISTKTLDTACAVAAGTLPIRRAKRWRSTART